MTTQTSKIALTEDVLRGINFSVSFTLNTMTKKGDEKLRLLVLQAAKALAELQEATQMESSLLTVDSYFFNDKINLQ